ncbi:hypothetical protein [Novipirellula rosea]|uniref:Uncharacterized protein n=1 Tax=Novipirellula rosea TaxID=1031540 RepID=A0ABP8N5P3_9BACT
MDYETISTDENNPTSIRLFAEDEAFLILCNPSATLEYQQAMDIDWPEIRELGYWEFDDALLLVAKSDTLSLRFDFVLLENIARERSRDSLFLETEFSIEDGFFDSEGELIVEVPTGHYKVLVERFNAGIHDVDSASLDNSAFLSRSEWERCVITLVQ